MRERFLAEDREPDLTHEDIAWGRGGLSVGVVLDTAEAAPVYRDLLQEALSALARQVIQIDRASATNATLRDAVRRRREERAA